MSSAQSKLHEPSMEEILASIRRIIADDQEVLRDASQERSKPSNLASVLDITQRQSAQPQGAQGLGMPGLGRESFASHASHSVDADGQPASGASTPFLSSETDEGDEYPLNLVTYDDPPDEDESDFSSASPASRAASGSVDPARADTLLSSSADASVSDAFSRLGATLMPTRPQTLEDLMKDLLRPMLKEWLDANLPALVERLVQAEIDRVARNR